MKIEYRQQLPPLWFWQDGPMQYHFVECVASVEATKGIDMTEKKDALHVHIDADKKRADLPEFNEDACPHCGGEVEQGFGLAGGGFGIYSYCGSCGQVVSKSEVEE